MASYLAPYLESFLSEYFSNFQPENLSIGYTGSATLTDLNLRSDVLDQFNLPFRVIGGKVGNLYISLGGIFGVAKLLTSTPEIEVTLSDVYLLAVPPTALPYEKENEEKKALDSKRKELAKLEDKRNAAAEEAGKPKESSDPGFVSQLIVGLINNVKITIENIHIRYEDDKLNPQKPFSMGVVLKNLKAETTDKDWAPAELEKSSKTFFKLVDLDGLGVYWNSGDKNFVSKGKDTSEESLTQIVADLKVYLENPLDGGLDYILGPLALDVKAMVTMKPDKLDAPFSLPLADVKIEMPKLIIDIEDQQFADAMNLTGDLQVMMATMHYRKFRPWGIGYMGHAKEWWKFAGDCLLVDVRRRHQNWSWEHIKTHRDLCKKYSALYSKAILDDDATDEDKAAAAALEDQLDNFNIMLLRGPIDLANIRKKNLIAEKTKALWYGTATLTKEEMDEILSGKLPPDEISNIYEMIDYKPEEAGEEAAKPTDPDYARIKASFNLPKIQVNASKTLKDKSLKILTFTINDIKTGFEQYPVRDGMKVEFSIEDIGITGIEDGPPPTLLRAVKTGGDTHYLSTTFEKNPSASSAAIRLKFNSEQLEIIYDGKTVQALVECFTPPVHVEATKVKSKVALLDKAAAQKVKEFLKKNEEMDIDVSVSAPYIIIPENGKLTESSSALIFNLGNLTIKSVPRQDGGISQVDGDVDSENLSPEVLALAYSQYQIKLSNFEFLMALPGENKFLEPTPGAGPAAVFLSTGEIVVGLDQTLMPEDKRFPKVHVCANLPKLAIEVTDRRVLALARMALCFPIPSKPPTASIARLADNPASNLASEMELLEFENKSSIKSNTKHVVKKLPDGTIVIEETTTTTVTSTVQKIGARFDPEHAVQFINLSAKFTITEFSIQLDEENNDGKKKPLLDFCMLGIEASVQAREFGTAICASIGSLSAEYKQIGKGDSGADPIYLFQTHWRTEEVKDPLVMVYFFMISPDCPKISEGAVRQSISARLSSLDLVLHQEWLAKLLRISQRIQGELALVKRPGTEIIPTKQVVPVGAKKPDANNTRSKNVAKKANKDENPKDTLLKVKAELASFSLTLMSNKKSIMRFSVEEVAVNYDDRPKQSVVLVNLDSIRVQNLDTPTIYPDIIIGQDSSEKLIGVKLVIYKEPGPSDTAPELGISLSLASHKITILGSFLGNIMGFINEFQALKEAAAAAAKQAAKEAAAALKKSIKNEPKLDINIKICSPEFVLPKDSNSREALSVNLGLLQLKNKLTAIPSHIPGKNAIMDDLTFTLDGLKLSRTYLNANDQGVQAETLILVPTSIKLDVTRNISASWYDQVPMIKAEANLEPIEAQLSGDDVVLAACGILGIVYELDTGAPPTSPAAAAEEDTSTSVETTIEQAQEKVSWTASADIKINKVGLALYTSTCSLEDKTGLVCRDPALSFAELFIQNTTFTADIWSNADMKVNLAVQNMIIQDTRKTEGDICDFLTRRSYPGSINTDDMILVKLDIETLPDKMKNYKISAITSSIQLILNMTFFRVLLQFFQNIIENLPKPKIRLPPKKSKDDDEDDDDEVADAPRVTTKTVVPAVSVPSKIVGATQKPITDPPLIDANIKIQEMMVLVLEDPNSNETNTIVVVVDANFDMKPKNGDSIGSGELHMRSSTAKFSTSGLDAQMAEILSPTCLTINVALTRSNGTVIDLILSDASMRLSAGTIFLLSKIAKSLTKSLSTIKTKGPEVEYHPKFWKPTENSNSELWFLDPEKLDQAVYIHDSSLESPSTAKKVIAEKGLALPIRETLTFKSNCFAFSLEVGTGANSTPALSADLRVNATVTNWSTKLAADGLLKASAAYNNAYFGTWEYILEPVESSSPTGETSIRPWEISFKVSKENDDKPFKIDLISKDIMEITIAKTGLGILNQILSSFKTAAFDAISEGDVKSAPYVLRNHLGYDLTLNIDGTPFVNIRDKGFVSGDIKVADGQDLDLGLKPDIGTFGKSGVVSPRSFKISIPDLKFNEDVTVNQGKSRYFELPTKKGSNGESDVILFDVDMTNNGSSVVVTVRSIVQFLNELECAINVHKAGGGVIATIQPNAIWSLPLDLAYEKSDGIDFTVQGFGKSVVPFSWPNLRKDEGYIYTIDAAPDNGVGNNANIKVIGDVKEACKGNTDEITKSGMNYEIHLQGHLVVNNVSPVPVILESDGKTVYEIAPGRSKTIFCITPKGSGQYDFTLKLSNFRGSDWTSKVSLSDSDDILTPVIFQNADASQNICFAFQKTKESNFINKTDLSQLINISVFCPYWMVNRTGLKLSYKGSSGSIITTQGPEEGPVLFAYEQNLGSEKGMVQCEDSEWSTGINFDAAGLPGSIICDGKDRKYELTVTIELSECQLTKIITFTARHIITNACPFPIIISEVDRPDDLVHVPKDKALPFYPTGTEMKLTVQVEDPSEEDETSVPVYFDRINDSILRLENKYGGVRALIQVTETNVNIAVSEFQSGEVPLIIVNESSDLKLRFVQKEAENTKERLVDYAQNCTYAWDDLTVETKVMEWGPAGYQESVKLTLNFDADEDGEFVGAASQKTYYWNSFSNGIQRILFVGEDKDTYDKLKKLQVTSSSVEQTSDTLEDSGLKEEAAMEKASLELSVQLAGIGVSVVNNMAGRDILYLRLNSTQSVWEASPSAADNHYRLIDHHQMIVLEKGYQDFTAGVSTTVPATLPEGIEVDFTNFHMTKPYDQQLRRHNERPGLSFKFASFPNSLTVDLRLSEIQIDNQTPSPRYPRLFVATTIPTTVTTTSEASPPMLILNLKKSTTPASSVQIIKATVILQEFNLGVDLYIIDDIMNAISDDSEKTKVLLADYQNDYDHVNEDEHDYSLQLVENAKAQKTILVFDDVQIYKLTFNLSFSLGGSSSYNPLKILVMGLGATLVNITDKHFDISGLHIQHLRASPAQLTEQIVSHYKYGVIKNMFTLVLELDVLGNPYKLLTGIGSGIGSLLTDPIQGAMEGHLVEGLTSGVGAVLDGTVGNLLGTVGLLTGSLAKGTEALGLGFLGLGYLSGGVTALRNIAKKKEKGSDPIRPPRMMKPLSYLEPYSEHKTTTAILFNQLQGGTFDYITHISVDGAKILMLTKSKVFYATLDDEMKSVQETIWGHAWGEFTAITGTDNSVDFNQKSAGGYFFRADTHLKVNVPNPAVCKIVLAQAQSAFKSATGVK